MKKKRLNKTRFFLLFILLVLIYFSITYTIVNKETIGDQFEVISEGGSFFARTATYRVLNLEKDEIGFDKDTSEIEFIVFNQINKIRKEVSLNELKWDPLLAELSRQHSYDMAKNSYFNHTNLEGLGPSERAKNLGIKTHIETQTKIFDGVGENLGFMPKGVVKDIGVLITTDDIASAQIYQWMLSEPHKENILKNDYYFTGIGVAYDGKGNYYIGQTFQ